MNITTEVTRFPPWLPWAGLFLLVCLVAISTVLGFRAVRSRGTWARLVLRAIIASVLGAALLFSVEQITMRHFHAESTRLFGFKASQIRSVRGVVVEVSGQASETRSKSGEWRGSSSMNWTISADGAVTGAVGWPIIGGVFYFIGWVCGGGLRPRSARANADVPPVS